MVREEKKESYEPLEMEIIPFEEEDVIITSVGDGSAFWGPDITNPAP